MHTAADRICDVDLKGILYDPYVDPILAYGLLSKCSIYTKPIPMMLPLACKYWVRKIGRIG